MATIAATVPDVIVGVATIIVPLRDPVLLAKQMVTLESFFPGRTIVGVGSGQYESEFEAFGSDGYHSRGKITDEYLTIMRELFTRDLASHAGAYRSIDGASFYPKPPVGAPPLWIGGNSPAAVRRAREFGSGWIMSQAVSPSDVALHLGAGEVSAGAAPLSAVLTATVAPGAADELVQEDAHRVHRHPSVVRGDPAEVAAGLSEYIAAGVTHLLLSFRADDVPSLQRHMRWFSEEVRPLLPPRRPAAEPRPGPAQKRSGG
jgi:alkanesulfonate monooxygenase SsuD/methylene tetrahydromethanopterin reductase-like flavin-dependent oxidoreductase (luciferase family)